MTSSDPLLTTRKEQLHAKLYDVECMMAIKESVCNGYVVLLKGRPLSPANNTNTESHEKSKKKINNNNNNDDENDDSDALAFLALTSGNVIDACFGVANTRSTSSTPTSRSVNDAKTLLEENCLKTDTFRRTAIAAYCDAFQVTIVHHEKIRKLNCLTRCFRSRKIQRQTGTNIKTAFIPLIMALEELRMVD